ncbi:MULTISPECIES: acyl carrier protein [Streptomyces]|uniref:acyl carrier protein n=1 Tax=Streptomyces TaxID=1883 RepID=UPI000699BDDA|nr:phosphopantetheine-binding protein [Streptomyces sp. SID7805]MYU55616.1 acyl carrier protein [Streptomyces sp. SID7805]
MTTMNPGIDAAGVEKQLIAFLAERTGAEPAPEQDLFDAGLVSSMFAMQLVVHLEDEYDIEIVGPELSMDNFRSVRAMSALVLRLRDSEGEGESDREI